MNAPDVINGGFELAGGVMQWMNVRALRRDQKVKGVDWRAWAVFGAWGWWNLFYYPQLGQWWSTAGGLVIVAANTTWVALALYYRKAARCRRGMFGCDCACQ